MVREEFSVKEGQVDIIVKLHDYNGHHFRGEINFKGHVNYVQKIREGLGKSITTIRDRIS